MRKKRSDRNHIIYQIENTINGKSYIGITAARGTKILYSALRRFQKHVCRAKTETLNWSLYKDMRKYGPDVYNVWVLEVVRGKAEVHKREVELIKQYKPKLNSTH